MSLLFTVSMIQHGNSFFLFFSIASMILGALAAMAQNKVKKLLAYSSIGHVGNLFAVSKIPRLNVDGNICVVAWI
jgi:NADH:ubiquinone oxidoreductase subunit 2 (subunit N)